MGASYPMVSLWVKVPVQYPKEVGYLFLVIYTLSDFNSERLQRYCDGLSQVKKALPIIPMSFLWKGGLFLIVLTIFLLTPHPWPPSSLHPNPWGYAVKSILYLCPGQFLEKPLLPMPFL